MQREGLLALHLSPWWIFSSADASLSSNSMLLEKSQGSSPTFPTQGCAFPSQLWCFLRLPPSTENYPCLMELSCQRNTDPPPTHTHTHTHTHTPLLSANRPVKSSPAPEFPWGLGQRLCSDTCLPIYLPHENGEGPQRNSKGTDTNHTSWPSPVNINWPEASQELQAGLYWGSCTHRRE